MREVKMPQQLSLADALLQHELDVAGLELSTPRRQYQNLILWMRKVTGAEKEKADRLVLAFAKRYHLKDTESGDQK